MLPNLPPERRPGAATAYLGAWGGALAEISARSARLQGACGARSARIEFSLWTRLREAKSRSRDGYGSPGVLTSLTAGVLIGLSQPTRVYSSSTSNSARSQVDPPPPMSHSLRSTALLCSRSIVKRRSARRLFTLTAQRSPQSATRNSTPPSTSSLLRHSLAIVAPLTPTFSRNSASGFCLDCLDEVAFAGQGRER